MRPSGGLVAVASETLGVQPGKTENRTAFLQRLVYTITGLMGYASLWDMPEDGTDISIMHFKHNLFDMNMRSISNTFEYCFLKYFCYHPFHPLC